MAGQNLQQERRVLQGRDDNLHGHRETREQDAEHEEVQLRRNADGGDGLGTEAPDEEEVDDGVADEDSASAAAEAVRTAENIVSAITAAAAPDFRLMILILQL